ncbi:hypothetical protein GJ633_09370 [Halorubrum sp. CBA1125]|uniref:hypothetical protein n=1 Tax=Halorubrum sp. CBA1125 TaxID=2668072 RepID=UPI0012E8F410|nr:hypothetical protein [Halorubrum sp. CBA1125]MUW14849.1 hypothetical protein [Halorubrum sp. CBA1125]
MPGSDDCAGRVLGSGGYSYSVGWETDSHAEDGIGMIELCIQLGGFDVELSFRIDEAETFLEDVRDEIVRAKQAELEWETDTDPETGVES